MKPLFPDRFRGKCAVVTGAAQGIGKATALRLAQEGASVVLVDRSPIVEEVVSEAEFGGLQALAAVADLEYMAGFELALSKAKQSFRAIDIMINNVGGTIWTKPYAHYEEQEIEAEIRRSLFPTLLGCRAVLPYFLKQHGGVIVNISSIATRGIHRVPYSAAKGGVNALTASLAFEYAQQNIRVNAVAVGGTEVGPRKVPRNPNSPSDQEKRWHQEMVEQTIASSLMKRYGTLDEQVATILFLASDESSYITGVVLPVGGGDLG
jgi:dihydroxycyclohexadiene carboxylate dehydrogenase